MFSADEYALLDFGNGRKLERLGPWVLDRPCPAAVEFSKQQPKLWASADWQYQRTRGDQGIWHTRKGEKTTGNKEPWLVRHPGFCLELKQTEFGHVGVFPEQAANWDWITTQVGRGSDRPKVLNLFAYTGGSTLAAASAGAEVVHVDAAANTVAWARRNAAHSGLEAASIRWITEDALTFAQRELRRGNRYDGVILDPPSYGHGPKGQRWKIETQLAELLTTCWQLLAPNPKFMLLTCHSPGLTAELLKQSAWETWQVALAAGDWHAKNSSASSSDRAVFERQAVAFDLALCSLAQQSESGRQLPSGVGLQWVSD